MGHRGELNLGQLVRERLGREAVLVGFTTWAGSVTAAADWDAQAERKHVRPALRGSYEALFHETGLGNFYLDLGGPGGAGHDKSRMYELPARLRRNDWALSGDWMIKRDAVELNKPNGRIASRFHARDLHLVMGPSAPGTSVKFRVLIDGQPPGAAHGIDVDEQGDGTGGEQRLYELIRQTGPIADYQFEIEFLGPGVEAFCFTFGWSIV
jgi:hypothetical protein